MIWAHHLHASESKRFPTFSDQNQIDNLTSNFSFGHNLCFKYPNESCKPISDIYAPRTFHWYNEIFHTMSFDPCNCPLIPTRKVQAHLGVCGFIPSHPLTLLGAWNVTPGIHFWLAPAQALTLVVSSRLRLWHSLLHKNAFFFSRN
jgi:hypothetical protein